MQHVTASKLPPQRTAEPPPGQCDIEVFYDGECPLCTKEIAMLQRLDERRRIRFSDISAVGFDAGALGVTQEALMARIHGRLPDGTFIEGVEVFRRLYAAVGFERLVWLSRLPGLAWVLDTAYTAFAKRRLWLTGRCTADVCAR